MKEGDVVMSKKSAIVSGAGLLTSIFTTLVNEVQKRGGDDEDIHCLTTPEGEGLLGEIAELIVRRARKVFSVVVDYSRSLVQMIKAGNYNWVNSNITEKNFPIQGEGRQKTEVALFHFNKNMTSEQVIAEMDKQGYCPARIEELLAFGESQPDLQRQFSIIALGSIWRFRDGGRYVPVLYEDVRERRLDLVYFDGAWDPGYHFVGLRK